MRRGRFSTPFAIASRRTKPTRRRLSSPRELKQVWAEGARDDRVPLKLSREEFLERVKAEATLGTRRDARWMTLAVFAALKEHLSPGEAEDVFAQLPKDLKELSAEAQVEIGAG